MLKKTKTIMLVDEDEINRFITHKLLKSVGFSGNIIHFRTVEDAMEHLSHSIPDILIIDFFQNEQDKFRILQLDLPMSMSTIVLWDFNLEFVKLLSVLFPITSYYHKPLKIEDAKLIVKQLHEPQ